MANLNLLPVPPDGTIPQGVTDDRGQEAFHVRYGLAVKDARKTGSVEHMLNGDEKLGDASGSYSKGLAQADYAKVDPTVFKEFRLALGTSDGNIPNTALLDDNAVRLGGDDQLNGPLGAFTRALIGSDSQNYGKDALVFPAPSVASAEYAVELMELYWAAVLRDVPFTAYDRNPTAIAAARELSEHIDHYRGPTDGGSVTPALLFRGGGVPKNGKTYFDGEQYGPYISQFLIRPTVLGAVPVEQKLNTFQAGLDYMTTRDSWFAAQNGIKPAIANVVDPQRRYLHNGRGLCAYTHSDELYQAYLIAYLVLETLGVPRNPGCPYEVKVGNTKELRNQKPFGNFGGPDIASTLAAVARVALNAVWYQKWVVHLRHRPEAGGGLVDLLKTHYYYTPGTAPKDSNGTVKPGIKLIDADLHDIILGSRAVELNHVLNGSYLLSQAFPEGSPTHPAYPTGHGTVAGACLTVLKFFYDGCATIASPLVPSDDGLRLEAYGGPDIKSMTVNGELHKLAHNISFGHGVHAGIHWRSDTDASIALGEAVALDYLRDQAFTYPENFTIQIKKIDGSMCCISNVSTTQSPACMPDKPTP